MQDEPTAAVPLERYERPEVAVLVNFGLLAGREATQAEVEALARIVQQEVRSATIRREHHLEVNDQITASLHEVVIEVPDEVTAEHHPLVLRERLIHLATQWVRGCKEDPGEPQTLAERLARQAVIDADTQGVGPAANDTA